MQSAESIMQQETCGGSSSSSISKAEDKIELRQGCQALSFNASGGKVCTFPDRVDEKKRVLTTGNSWLPTRPALPVLTHL